MSTLLSLVLEAAGPVEERPTIVALDGRGGSGMTTLATRLQLLVPSSRSCTSTTSPGRNRCSPGATF